MRIISCCVALAVMAGSMSAWADSTTESRALATQLIQRLGVALKTELAANGAAGAVSVCRDIAPALAGELSRQSGGRVARVSLKVRNPLLGTADAWEQQILADFERRSASGERVETLEFSATVDEPGGRYFRYMKALPVQPLCLACHGAADNIPVAVKEILAVHYPHDLATGYAVGQLRGAVTIKHPVAGKR